MKRDQLIERIYEDYIEKIYEGKLLDSVEAYIRNYFMIVQEGIEKIQKYISHEVEVDFDNRNAFTMMRIKENAIHFYRRQDRIEVIIMRNGSKREDQILIGEQTCLSRMYDTTIHEAMEKYLSLAFE